MNYSDGGQRTGWRSASRIGGVARHAGAAIALLILGIAGAFCSAADLPTLDTPHYRIHTDLDTRLAEDLAVRMEAMYSQYALRLAGFSPPADQKLEVYLFRNRADYTALIGTAMPNTGGVFVPRRNLLAAFLEPQGRDGLHRTLQHEAFHQFAYSAIGPELPVWLNEGIAQVFEEGIFTGQTFMIGQVPPRRIRQLKQDIDAHRLVPFKDFLAMSDAQWKTGLRDMTTAASQYDQAWAMTHFLIFATDETGQPKYRSRLIAMLRMLKGGTRAGPAFAEAFSDNFDGFQQRFLEFSRDLVPTREASLVDQQSVLADMLVMLKQKGHRFDDVESFEKFLIDQRLRLRYTKGDMKWSTETDPGIYFRDAAGRQMNSRQLYFSPRSGAPLPDIVCEPVAGLRLRTVFHDGGGAVDHETNVEAF